MAQNDKIQLFEDKRIRTAWDEEKEELYFTGFHLLPNTYTLARFAQTMIRMTILIMCWRFNCFAHHTKQQKGSENFRLF